MPKTVIDYSNTIIYKITCKNHLVSDVYVGHTTNFVQRKHAHKQSCINVKSLNYKCKLYQVIRNNGGWENWKMEIINFFECKNQYEARKKEQEYFLSLNATLNSIEPYAISKPKNIVINNKVVKEVFYCKECNKSFNNKVLLDTHVKTKKHIKNILNMNEPSKTVINNFVCKLCDFNCDKKSNYEKHISTKKHINAYEILHFNKTSQKMYNCNCGKIYKFRQSLNNHKKICIVNTTKSIINPIITDSSNNENKTLTNILLELEKSNNEFHKSNNEFHKQMIDICKKLTNINENNIY